MTTLNWNELASGDHLRFAPGSLTDGRADLTYTVESLVEGAQPLALLRAYRVDGAVDLTLTPDLLPALGVTREEPWAALAAAMPEWVMLYTPLVLRPAVGVDAPPCVLSLATHLPVTVVPVNWRDQRHRVKIRKVAKMGLQGEAHFSRMGAAVADSALRDMARVRGWPMTLRDDGSRTDLTLAVRVAGQVVDVHSHGPSQVETRENSALILGRALRLALELQTQEGAVASG